MAALTLHRRATALAVALGLAAVAAYSLSTYVQNAEARALEGLATVEVYVAADEIPAGTPGERAIELGLIDREAIPAKVMAADPVTDLSTLQGRVAAITILPGEQIVRSRFVEPGSTEAPRLVDIPEGHHAIAVSVGVPSGLAGYVQPGDDVSILVHLPADAEAAQPEVVRYLLQGVQVLAVGQRIGTSEEGEILTRDDEGEVVLTLAVTPSQAERLGFGIFAGDLYFTLLPPGAEPASTGGATRTDALSD